MDCLIHGIPQGMIFDLDLLSFQSLRGSMVRLEKSRRSLDLSVATAASQAGTCSSKGYESLMAQFSNEEKNKNPQKWQDFLEKHRKEQEDLARRMIEDFQKEKL